MGVLNSKTDNDNNTIVWYDYDALGRTTGVEDGAIINGKGAGVRFTQTIYNDAARQVTVKRDQNKISDGLLTSGTTYDELYRVAETQEFEGSSDTSGNWSLGGDLLQENYPSTRAITFAYGNGDEPLGAWGSYTSNGTTVTPTYIGWMNFTAGLEVGRSYGAPGYYIWQRNHDNRGQLTALVLNNWDSPNNAEDYTGFQEYYYFGASNNNGNLLGKWENNSPTLAAVPGGSLSAAVNQNYTYDGVNRLSSVSDSSYSRTYCYDARGNGWARAATGVPALPGNAPQEIGTSCTSTTPYTANNQLIGNSYDAAGNQISFGGNTVAYDAENRMISVKTSTGNVVDSVLYDGDGRRVSKTNAAGTTSYIYDGLGRLAGEYVGGALSKEYVRMYSSYVPSSTELVAIENAPGNGSPCSTCFLLTDDLGSVRLVGDVNGNYISRHDFLPFGEETSSSDPNRPVAAGFTLSDSATQRFTGKERDSESGLDYFGARYYGSALGRFSSPDPDSDNFDPANPQTFNRYAYVWNNPLANIDPDGADTCPDGSQADVCVVDKGPGDIPTIPTGPTAGPPTHQPYSPPIPAPSSGGNTGNCVAGFGFAGAGVFGAIGTNVGANIGAGLGLGGGTLAEPGGGTLAGGIAGGIAGGAFGGGIGMRAGYSFGVALGNIVCSSGSGTGGGSDEGAGGAQDKKLSASEVRNLETTTGESAHQIKTEALGTNKNISQYDLYKDSQGKVFVKAKGGAGEAIPTGLVIK